MEIKHKNLLISAAVINMLIGLFFIICGIFEFTGILQTKANNVTETIGIQLSYLVLVSDFLVFCSGLITLFNRKSITHINLQIFMGIITLAWPMFLSISLLFTQLKINIRLMIMTITALYYVISVLVVKITNEEFIKTRTFNPSALISASGKRSQSVNVTSVFNHSPGITANKNIAQSMGNFAAGINPKNRVHLNISSLLKGTRMTNSGGFLMRVFGGHKRHNVNSLGKMFNKRRARGKRFRFPR